MRIENYSEIKNALSNSPAGESLKNIFRWSSGGFRNGETNDEWTRIIGATAQDFSHGELMYHIARNFAEREFIFTPIQEKTFLHGIAGHDWGEAIIDANAVGDVSAQSKTSEHENKEYIVFKNVIRSLELGKKTKKELLHGYEQTVVGLDPILNHAFKALETTEYVITVMKAYQNCQKYGIEMPTLEPLVGRVLTINLSKVLDNYVEKYQHSIGLLFKNSSKLIDEMFEYSLPWLENNDTWQGKPALKRKDKNGNDEVLTHKTLAEEFRVKWNNFKSKNNL